jgi:RNA polymerase sigma-70 factor (ECF subfamily)
MPANEATDADLLASAAAGDRDAFAALYRRRRLDVYRFALHMSGSPAIADDVTQDVFMSVIHDARRFDASRSTAVAWLLGIARNHVRRAASRRPMEPIAPLMNALRAPDVDLLAGLGRREHVDALRRAVLALPAKYREAVVLCDLHELTYDDAAASIGCAVGTVRSRLNRGRRLLAKQLMDHERALFPRPATRWLL